MGKKHQVRKLLSKKLKAKQGKGGRALPPRKAGKGLKGGKGAGLAAGGVQKKNTKKAKRPVPQNRDG
eukprot:scaffold606292_cov42-Prasinocladus_malaysianus.AAC.1